MSLSGHFWTIWPTLAGHAWPALSPRPTPWEAIVHDGSRGAVRLTGELREPPNAKSPDAKGLVIVVPGLGGNAKSVYIRKAVRDLCRLGWASLVMPQRGGDLCGEDIYHASLTADLHAAAGSPVACAYEHVYVLGFSMGGHVALRFAADSPPARVRAVAAVCSPIDLFAASRFIDQPRCRLYRWHVMRALKKIYRAVEHAGHGTTPLGKVLAANKIREWDTLTIVPRFGFRDANDYYARASVAAALPNLTARSLLLLSTRDPMVAAGDVRRALPNVTPKLEVQWHACGGHVHFPRRFRLIERVCDWFAAQAQGNALQGTAQPPVAEERSAAG